MSIPNCNQQVIMHNGMMGQFVPFQATPPMQFQQPVVQTPQMSQQPPLYQEPQNLLRGRTVDKVEDITVNDVPTVGAALFPLSDGSQIIKKSWTNDGNINTDIYVLMDPIINKEETPIEPNAFDDFKMSISERFDKLERLISNNRQSSYTVKHPRREDGDKNV